MDQYFKRFPLITYNGQQAVDITRRAVLLNKLYNNPNLYYQYDVKPGERPDTIANRYYNDPYRDWMLYFSNKIVDPYFEWYLDDVSFNNLLADKYGSYLNAITKTKFYRNNWYNDQNPISLSTYNALDPSLHKFYVANYGSNPYNTYPLNYTRDARDWIVTTNYQVSFNVANSSNFINDEIVDVTISPNNTMKGQVCFNSNNVVILQHMSGNVFASAANSSYMVGRESATNTSLTSANVIVTNISLQETPYWSPVTYFDYETEVNENNKNIQVLNSSYAQQLSKQLTTIIGS